MNGKRHWSVTGPSNGWLQDGTGLVSPWGQIIFVTDGKVTEPRIIDAGGAIVIAANSHGEIAMVYRERSVLPAWSKKESLPIVDMPAFLARLEENPPELELIRAYTAPDLTIDQAAMVVAARYGIPEAHASGTELIGEVFLFGHTPQPNPIILLGVIGRPELSDGAFWMPAAEVKKALASGKIRDASTGTALGIHFAQM